MRKLFLGSLIVVGILFPVTFVPAGTSEPTDRLSPRQLPDQNRDITPSTGTPEEAGMSAAALVEMVSGQSLDSYLDERIYTPLGMHDSYNHELPEKLDGEFDPEHGLGARTAATLVLTHIAGPALIPRPPSRRGSLRSPLGSSIRAASLFR